MVARQEQEPDADEKEVMGAAIAAKLSNTAIMGELEKRFSSFVNVGQLPMLSDAIASWLIRDAHKLRQRQMAAYGMTDEDYRAMLTDPRAVALAYAYLYDKRGGAIEIEIKEDKQGFGLAKRNKKRYYAQAVVVLLSALAHNVVVWSREWLSEVSKIKRHGVLRMVRDVFHVCGFVEVGAKNSIGRIVLSESAAWARRCANSLRLLLKQEHVRVTLDEI